MAAFSTTQAVGSDRQEVPTLRRRSHSESDRRRGEWLGRRGRGARPPSCSRRDQAVARVLVDASAVYALLDRNDNCHHAARTALQTLRKGRSEPLLTNFIVAECHALSLSRLGAEVARNWLLGNVWPVERVNALDSGPRSTEEIHPGGRVSSLLTWVHSSLWPLSDDLPVPLEPPSARSGSARCSRSAGETRRTPPRGSAAATGLDQRGDTITGPAPSCRALSLKASTSVSMTCWSSPRMAPNSSSRSPKRSLAAWVGRKKEFTTSL